MIALQVNSITSEKEFVISVHYQPNHPEYGIVEAELQNYILVDEMLQPPALKVGEGCVHFINCVTKEQWYEIISRPLTQEEKVQQMMEDNKSANQKYTELDKLMTPIEELRKAKMAALDEMCSLTIINGFDHDINGVSYHFSCSLPAQANFTGAEGRFARGKITEVEWTVVNNVTGKEERIVLDQLTFEPIADKVFDLVDTSVKKLRNTLQPQVEVASVDNIDSIVW